MKKKKEVVRKKAWAVIYNTGDIVGRCRSYGSEIWLDTPDGLMIFAEKEHIPSGTNIVPVEITYTLPTKKK